MDDDEHEEQEDQTFPNLDALVWNHWKKRNIREIIERYEDFVDDRRVVRDENLETLLQKQIENANELERLIVSDPNNYELQHRLHKEMTDMEIQKGNERTGFWRDIASIIPRVLDLELEYKDLGDLDRMK